jgi:hypothetical protein
MPSLYAWSKHVESMKRFSNIGRDLGKDKANWTRRFPESRRDLVKRISHKHNQACMMYTWSTHTSLRRIALYASIRSIGHPKNVCVHLNLPSPRRTVLNAESPQTFSRNITENCILLKISCNFLLKLWTAYLDVVSLASTKFVSPNYLFSYYAN